MRSTLVYKGYGESLEVLDPAWIHRIRFTLVYKGCGESLEGVGPPRVHRMRCTLVYKRCGEPLKVVPFKDSPHDVYTSLQGSAVNPWRV